MFGIGPIENVADATIPANMAANAAPQNGGLLAAIQTHSSSGSQANNAIKPFNALTNCLVPSDS
ncbi:hypothetical protein ELE36_14425 [Pseudolysobacter antarcticus]|uniref:Uncharacterized protein n=1 Tax=Pseudolysobacter antarcticus TaxID=2511995 RepID=A0A411HM60_9GAMM|nr:hypothetical protein [Pseudolysobacter antarcticus]QBB71457.1 hypothetical protein ELE36_14425 [Pseudolysobacter antarcticus]